MFRFSVLLAFFLIFSTASVAQPRDRSVLFDGKEIDLSLAENLAKGLTLLAYENCSYGISDSGDIVSQFGRLAVTRRACVRALLRMSNGTEEYYISDVRCGILESEFCFGGYRILIKIVSQTTLDGRPEATRHINRRALVFLRPHSRDVVESVRSSNAEELLPSWAIAYIIEEWSRFESSGATYNLDVLSRTGNYLATVETSYFPFGIASSTGPNNQSDKCGQAAIRVSESKEFSDPNINPLIGAAIGGYVGGGIGAFIGGAIGAPTGPADTGFILGGAGIGVSGGGLVGAAGALVYNNINDFQREAETLLGEALCNFVLADDPDPNDIPRLPDLPVPGDEPVLTSGECRYCATVQMGTEYSISDSEIIVFEPTLVCTAWETTTLAEDTTGDGICNP